MKWSRLAAISILSLIAIPHISSAETNVISDSPDQFLLSGYLYAGYRMYGGETEIPDKSFFLRRAGLEAEVSLTSNLETEIQIETRSDSIYLKDAWLNWEPATGVEFRIGQFKKPFCLNSLLNSWELMSVEHSLTHELLTDLRFSGRDLGLRVRLEPKWPLRPRLELGIFNGSGFRTALNEDNEIEHIARLRLRFPAGIDLGAGFITTRIGEAAPETPSGYRSSSRQMAYGLDLCVEHPITDKLDLLLRCEYVQGDNWADVDVFEGVDVPRFRTYWFSAGGFFNPDIPGIWRMEAAVNYEYLKRDPDTDQTETIFSPVLGVYPTRDWRFRLSARSYKNDFGYIKIKYTDYVLEAAVRF